MKKFITFALIAAMMLTMLVANVSAAEAWDGTKASTALEGDGSAATPYLVKSAEDLAFLAKSVDEGTTYAGKYITQTADIDLGNKVFPTIGNDGKQFQGVYDGKGFKITNYVAKLNEFSSGLFARVNSTADFQAAVINVTLEGSITEMNYTNANASPNLGVLVGKLAGSGNNLAVVANCVVDVDVNVEQDCGTSSQLVYLGGIVGYATGAQVINCVNKGDINVVVAGKHSIVGGIVAQSYYQMVVEGCVNLGNISVEGQTAGRLCEAGGIMGRTNGNQTTAYSVKNNVNYGNVTAKSAQLAYASGVVARAFNGNTRNLTIENCANKGKIHGETVTVDQNAYAGGILCYENIGYVTVKNCVNNGEVTAAAVNNDVFPGGIIGVTNYQGTPSTSKIENCVSTIKAVGYVYDPATLVNNVSDAEATVVDAAIKAIEDTQKATKFVTINGTAYNYVAPVVPAPETTTPAAPETTTPAPENTTPSTPSNPNTGDVTSIIVLALVAVSCGAVLTLKKTR